MLPLNKRQFIKQYLIDFDPVKAGIRAGMTPEDARKKTLEWLQEEGVKLEIDGICELYRKEFQSNTLKTLRELDIIAHSDIRKLYNPDGTFKGINELDDETAATIAEVRYKRDPVTESNVMQSVKLWDKIAGLTAKAKHQKIMSDVGGGVNITIQAEEIEKPLDAGKTGGGG